MLAACSGKTDAVYRLIHYQILLVIRIPTHNVNVGFIWSHGAVSHCDAQTIPDMTVC